MKFTFDRVKMLESNEDTMLSFLKKVTRDDARAKDLEEKCKKTKGITLYLMNHLIRKKGS